MSLRRATIDKILLALDKTIFTRHLFNYSFNHDDGTLVRIIYSENNNFQFVASYDLDEMGENKIWNTQEAPGTDFINLEYFFYDNLDALLMGISNWVNRILEEEDLGTHVLEHIERIREKIIEDANNIPDPEKPFEGKEAQEYKNKLDILYEEIENMNDQHKLTWTELEKIRKGIDSLKQQIEGMPRKTWLKAAGNKILDTVASISGKVTVEVLTKTIMNALPGLDS